MGTLRDDDGESRVHAELLLPEVLRGSHLDEVAAVFRRVAPEWSRRVVASASEGGAGVPIDFGKSGSIEQTLDLERARLGALGFGEASDAQWFEGATREFELQVERNDHAAVRRGRSLALTNRITLIVPGRTVENQPAARWIVLAISTLANRLDPVYGFARTFGEFAWKNKTPPTPRGSPMGLDLSRSLPGLYWLNLFGGPYVELIGRSRLLATPAGRVEEVGVGVVVSLSEGPWSWRTPEYRDTEQRVLDHLGRDLFYDRAAVDRVTRAPSLTPQN